MQRHPTPIFRLFQRDARGVAAVEFAFGALVLVIGLLNAVDVGYYAFERMEVESAAQSGAQAAWATCFDTTAMLPATQNCAGLNNAITNAIQGTSLGASVALSSGFPSEGYYCATSSGSLQSVGSLAARPADCTAAGNPGVGPGDYVQVGVTFPYAPLFPGLSVMGVLGITSITTTSWMRLG
jgi:Flp pilus assembly protein TadG